MYCILSTLNMLRDAKRASSLERKSTVDPAESQLRGILNCAREEMGQGTHPISLHKTPREGVKHGSAVDIEISHGFHALMRMREESDLHRATTSLNLPSLYSCQSSSQAASTLHR